MVNYNSMNKTVYANKHLMKIITVEITAVSWRYIHWKDLLYTSWTSNVSS